MEIMVHTKQEVEQLLDNLIKLHYFEIQEFSIAQNDQDIMFVLGNTDMPHDEYTYEERNRSIWKLTIEDGSVVQLTSPEEDAHAPCWSPNGKSIAYLSRASGKKEVWQMNQDGSNQIQLTSSEFTGKDPFGESQMQWSPDGRLIAYTVQPNGSYYGLWQSLIKKEKTSTNIQVENGENKHNIFSRQQARSTFESAIFILNPETGENKCITSSGQPYSIIHWYADDKYLLISNGQTLEKIHIETAETEQLYSGGFDLIKQVNKNLLSARITDNHIEIGHIHDNDFINKREVNISGSEFITLHTWSHDGNKLFFTDQEGMSNILYSVNIQTGEVKALTEQGKTVEDIPTCLAKIQSYHQRDAIIFPYSDPEQPTELWEASGSGEIRQISNLCHAYTPITLSEVEIIEYLSNGFKIESILVFPKNYDATKTYPTLVYLHGGPEDYVRANFSELISGRAQSAAHFLADHGYAILMPNFRGSGGYGEAFMYELANYQMLQAPYEDVIAGVDYLVEAGIANPEKLGVYGSSFGGILTAWTISQSSRFKGAIGAIGLYDLLLKDRYHNDSFHSISENRSKGTIPNDLWFQPDVYKKISPMEHFEKINTPMLFVETGAERDLIGSSARPLFNALVAREIKTNLIYYPEAFHSCGWNDVYKRDYMKRLVAWFDYCIKGIDLPDWFEKT